MNRPANSRININIKINFKLNNETQSNGILLDPRERCWSVVHRMRKSLRIRSDKARKLKNNGAIKFKSPS